MKRVAGVLSFILLNIWAGTVLAQTKAVVIPLGGSKSSGIQHYRINQLGVVGIDTCETASFTTPNAEIEAVLTLNRSILPTAAGSWWAFAQYSNDGGTTWNQSALGVTVAGATVGVVSNTSSTALEVLAPNTTYRFRIHHFGTVAHSDGQCELFITFNRKEATPTVTTAAAAAVSPSEIPTGIGSAMGE